MRERRPLLSARRRADRARSGGDPGEGGTPDPSGPFAIGGAVFGLLGEGLVLQDVGPDDLAIEHGGPFTFATRLPTRALYNVTVSSQPPEPSQTCAVFDRGAGVVAGDARDVAGT